MKKITASILRFSQSLARMGSVLSQSWLPPRTIALLFFLLLLGVLSACADSNEQQTTQEISSSQPGLGPQSVIVQEGETKVKSTEAPVSPTVVSSPSATAITPDPREPATKVPERPLNDLAIRSADISVYPDGPIFAGDLVSIRIDPRIPEKLAPNDVGVRIFVDGAQVVSNNINWRGLEGAPFGLYQWVWDTNKDPGFHSIIVFLDPEDVIKSGDESPANNVASLMVQVEQSINMPEQEFDAAWIMRSTACCRVHVVSGTAAHRDLNTLMEQVDTAFQNAAVKLSATPSGPYEVYFVDRIIGQGGYAQDSMVVSYIDRDYLSGELDELLVHEAVHLIDRKIVPNPITFLSEGIAVWIAGGHYHQQDLNQRMNALIEIGRYRSLNSVIDNFYGTQHEVAYLEGAGFIDYLVSTYGLDQVLAFYSETTARDADTLSEAVNVNLQRLFGKELKEIEADWMAYVRNLPRDKDAVENLRTTIRFYDIVRRYQEGYDPSAYYLTTWLPDPAIAERLGATADFSRHRETPVNIALETILVSAGSALQQEDYDNANALLDSIDRVLDNNGAFLDPLALAYLNIVLTASDMGYEVHQIELIGDQATVLGSESDDPFLVQIDLALVEGRDWALAR